MRVEDLLRGTGGPQLAPLQDAHAVGDLGNLVEVVGDYDDRSAPIPQGTYDAEQVLAGGWVKPSRRLVEHEDLRGHRQHASDRHPPLLAAGERVWGTSGEVRGAEQLQRLADPSPCLLFTQPESAWSEGHVLLDGRGEESGLGKLKYEAYPAA